MIKKLTPIVEGSGFTMDGYDIWASSVIKNDEGKYCMFAARTKNLEDRVNFSSEIVLAVTDDLSLPFEFEKVILSVDDSPYNDTHSYYNPSIIKWQDKYVLFFSAYDGYVGYAVSDSVYGPFVRCEKFIKLPFKAYNPWVIVDMHGFIRLFIRDENSKVYIAEAKTPDSEFNFLRSDVYPLGKIEDMCVFNVKFGYHMIALDTEGIYGGLENAGSVFRSSDGIYWHPAAPTLAYSFTVELASDGSALTVERREHPVIFTDETGKYLFTSCKLGDKYWNMVQKVSE